MEIFHLRYFVAIAEELNFSRAAARLNISASPLSRRIKDLEHELGTTLFVRSPQRVRLTPAGQMLFPLASDVVERFDALRQSFARPVASESHRVLRIGVAPDVTTAVRKWVVAQVDAVDESSSVRFVPGCSAELSGQVLEGALDFALVHGGRTGGPLRARLLDRQPVGVALSSDLPLAVNDSVTLGDLCALSWATIDQQAAPSIYRRTDALLARNGVLKRAVIDSTNVADLLHLVLDGNAFALVGLKAGATRKAFLGEPVSILPVRGQRLSLPTNLIWRVDAAEPESSVAQIIESLQKAP